MPRLTSAGTYAEFKHGRNAGETAHVQHLYMHANISGGTFRLTVNGETTADITITGTEATDVASINTALDALALLEDGDIVCSGTELEDLTLTGAANGYYKITIPADHEALSGNTSDEPNITTAITTIGGAWIGISVDLSTLSYDMSSNTSDVTPMGQLEEEVIVVKNMASFNFELYHATQTWLPIIHDGVEGRLRVFNSGKTYGGLYLEMEALIEEASWEIPDHDVVSGSFAGRRQGKWIAEPNSVWNANS